MANKPKLVLITDQFPFGKGEASFILPELAVLKDKFEITIVSKNSVDEQTSPVDSSIRVYRYPGSSTLKKLLYCVRGLFDRDVREEIRAIRRGKVEKTRRLTASFYTYAAACDFYKFLKKNNLDRETAIFYSYWNNYAAYALARFKHKFRGAKVITRMHGYDVFHERCPGGRQPLKAQTDRKLDMAVFASARAMEYYIEQFATQERERYRVFHLGVRGAGKGPYSPSETLRLFSCSNLVPVKRVSLLVEALSLLDNIAVVWTHAGGGEQEGEITALARKLLSGKKNITYAFLGHMENKRVRERMGTEELDCFISVTETEGGVPVSMMEACSAGLPVIATNAGGVREIVNGQTGVLLPLDVSAQEVADALTAFHGKSAEEKRAMRAAAYQMWEQNYDAEKNYPRFAETLQKLV